MTVQETIAKFERLHVADGGHYIGPDWRKLFYGPDWPYAYGQYIPVDKRYSAAASYNWHWKAWRTQGANTRPINFPNPDAFAASYG